MWLGDFPAEWFDKLCVISGANLNIGGRKYVDDRSQLSGVLIRAFTSLSHALLALQKVAYPLNRHSAVDLSFPYHMQQCHFPQSVLLYCLLYPWEQISVKLKWKYKNIFYKEMNFKIPSSKWWPFRLDPMCWYYGNRYYVHQTDCHMFATLHSSRMWYQMQNHFTLRIIHVLILMNKYPIYLPEKSPWIT